MHRKKFGQPLTNPERISDMKTRAFFVGCCLLLASLGPALADSVTATITAWDATGRTITLEDQSQFAAIPKEVAVPDLKAGDQVTVDYYADEDGVQAINSITLTKDVAKRLLPPTEKRG
jgi:hypothetical protein